jgi:hypothetical protein
MFALLCFVLAVLASPFKSKSRLESRHLRQPFDLLAETTAVGPPRDGTTGQFVEN